MLSLKLRSSALSQISSLFVVFFLMAAGNRVSAADGHWSITQTSIQNALGVQINNSGEMVWFLNAGGGIYSSVRGKLADSGLFPTLANSGEVVYADTFPDSGFNWDLVSTTRGRLTFGGAITPDSVYDVNSSGEVVYIKSDPATGHRQVYSTVRGFVTSDAADHYFPHINDNGEVVSYEIFGGASHTVSTTRGVLPANYGFGPLDLNNHGDICFNGNLYSPVSGYTSPHIFSSAHGVIIDNPDLYQWDGGINDAGVIVWDAPVTPGSSTWYVYQAQWVVPEPSALSLLCLGGLATLYRDKRAATKEKRRTRGNRTS
jgi:PEP-CTERM putative exosortase interaction domain